MTTVAELMSSACRRTLQGQERVDSLLAFARSHLEPDLAFLANAAQWAGENPAVLRYGCEILAEGAIRDGFHAFVARLCLDGMPFALASGGMDASSSASVDRHWTYPAVVTSAARAEEMLSVVRHHLLLENGQEVSPDADASHLLDFGISSVVDLCQGVVRPLRAKTFATLSTAHRGRVQSWSLRQVEGRGFGLEFDGTVHTALPDLAAGVELVRRMTTDALSDAIGQGSPRTVRLETGSGNAGAGFCLTVSSSSATVSLTDPDGTTDTRVIYRDQAREAVMGHLEQVLMDILAPPQVQLPATQTRRDEPAEDGPVQRSRIRPRKRLRST
jgi:hypothetical protein